MNPAHTEHIMRKKGDRHFIIQELDHYRTDLRAAETPSASPINDAGLDVTFEYLERVPADLLQTLGFASGHRIDEHTACLIVRHEGVPVGCRLFNLQGMVRHLYPFPHEMTLPHKHAYGFGFFIKQEFRGKGLGKLVHMETNKVLRDKFDYMDILVEPGNYISIRNAERLGFQKVKIFVFFKIFNLQWAFGVNPGFPYRSYKTLLNLGKLGARFTTGLPRLLQAAFQWAYRLKQELFLSSYTVKGTAPGEGLTGIFICRHKPDPTFLSKLFPDGCETQKNKIFPRMRLLHEFKNVPGQMDFIIADVRPRHVRRHLDRFAGAFIIPKWVRQTNPCFSGFSDFTRNKNRNAHRDIQSLRKCGYDYEFTKNEVLFRFFYEKMYYPYIHNRYPGEKVVLPFASMEKEFKKGGLILIKDKATGKYLSGSIINVKNGTFSAVKIGLLNGDPGLLRKEALTALYVAYFRFMEENKLRRADLGASRSFLNDGVLKYKAKWGTVINFDKRRGNIFIFRICKPSQRMDIFLAENPFISLEGREMVGNIFISEDDTSPEEDLLKDYKFKGLSRFRISRVKHRRADRELAAARHLSSLAGTQ